MASADDVVEDKADENSRHIVKRRRRRQVTRAGEDNRKVDILEEIDLELLVQNPLG